MAYRALRATHILDIKASNHATVVPRTTLLLRRLRSAIESDIGHQLTYEDLAERAGQSKSTMWNWFNGDGEPPGEIILSLIEHLPHAVRHQVIDSPGILRARPVVEHPRLAHNPSTVSHLKSLLLQGKGLTIVRGERDDLVTFVVAALCHSYRWTLMKPREVAGIDANWSDWVVPVPGVDYLSTPAGSGEAMRELDKLMPKLLSKPSQLVVLNGFQLSSTSDLVGQISQKHHLILGERIVPRVCSPTPKGMDPTHILTVTPERLNHDRIAVEIHQVVS